jgi:hypothetical protein
MVFDEEISPKRRCAMILEFIKNSHVAIPVNMSEVYSVFDGVEKVIQNVYKIFLLDFCS